jgi:hypothetical protein
MCVVPMSDGQVETRDKIPLIPMYVPSTVACYADDFFNFKVRLVLLYCVSSMK